MRWKIKRREYIKQETRNYTEAVLECLQIETFLFHLADSMHMSLALEKRGIVTAVSLKQFGLMSRKKKSLQQCKHPFSWFVAHAQYTKDRNEIEGSIHVTLPGPNRECKVATDRLSTRVASIAAILSSLRLTHVSARSLAAASEAASALGHLTLRHLPLGHLALSHLTIWRHAGCWVAGVRWWRLKVTTWAWA